MNETWHICVVIPARNEEVLLPRCLQSVRKAVEYIGGRARTDVIVAADLCSDRTSSVARAQLSGIGTVIDVRVGAAGSARRLATNVALRRRRRPLDRCWLANTDADCVVPHTWLSDQLQLAESDIEAFAGTVSVDSFEEHGPEVPSRFRSSYLIAPDGSHPHVHGANIGVRADVYVEAGGWGALSTAEDHDLWRRLCGLKKRLVSTATIEVITSGRRQGRAPTGFADALAAHNEVAA